MLTKEYTFTADKAAADARHAAGIAMTPQERCRAMMARINGATSRDIVRGRVY